MWDLYHKESWEAKIWCFWTVVLEKTLESRLDCMELKPVNPKGNQSWIFIGRSDAEAEAPILWPPDVKSGLTGKDPDPGKIKGRTRRGQQRMRRLDGIIDSKNMNLGKLWGVVRDKEVWCASIHGITKSWAQLGDWTTMGSWEVPPMSLGHCEKIPRSTENSRGFSSCIKRKNEN